MTPKIVSVEYVDAYLSRVRFADGAEGELDMAGSMGRCSSRCVTGACSANAISTRQRARFPGRIALTRRLRLIAEQTRVAGGDSVQSHDRVI